MRRIFWDFLSNSPTRRVGESRSRGVRGSDFECIKENWASQRVVDSLTLVVAMMSQGVAIQIFKNLASIFQTLTAKPDL
jgi:hypothetical protein